METSWLLLSSAVIALLAVLVLLRNAKTRRRLALPPGPSALLLLANLLWLRLQSSSANMELEPLLLRLFKRYGPIITLRIGSSPFIFVSDRHLAHAALVGTGTGSGVALANRPPGAPNTLLGVSDRIITRTDYGPLWRLLRRNLAGETLHPSRAARFAPARAWARRVLMDKLRGSDGVTPCDVAEAFQHAMFCLLLLMCFGERLDEPAVRAVEDAERAWVAYVSNPTQMGVFFFLPSITKHVFRGRLEAGRALRRRQKELFMPLINARREYKRQVAEQEGQAAPAPASETTFRHSYVDTLLDLTLPEEGNRRLTDDEVVALCSEFLNAGTRTTSTALQWIMAELVKNPDVQERLHAEIAAACVDDADEVSEEAVQVQHMPYLKAVILEGLRKHPPGHFVLPHKAADDMDVGGYLIPKGAMVNFMVAEMGRDEREWEKAMEFVPERFMEGGDGAGVDMTGAKRIRMMPFGVGRRICPGLAIAMLHLEFFVASLVREFEWKEVPGDEVDFQEKFQFTTVMKKPLRPRLVPRRR